VGEKLVRLNFSREKGRLVVRAYGENFKPKDVHLRSDLPSDQHNREPDPNANEISIPLPVIEVSLPVHGLPTPGARPSQFKVISSEQNDHTAHFVVEDLAGTAATLVLHRNKLVTPKLNGQLCKEDAPNNPHIGFSSAAYTDMNIAIPVSLCFPKGQGYQTLEFTLTW
jgi:hypothetical protein